MGYGLISSIFSNSFFVETYYLENPRVKIRIERKRKFPDNLTIYDKMRQGDASEINCMNITELEEIIQELITAKESFSK